MNEDRLKVFIGNKRKTKLNLNYLAQSYFVKPIGMSFIFLEEL